MPTLILHLEGGRFFFVEWAETPEDASLAVELHAPPDKLDEVRAPQDFFQKAFAVAQRLPPRPSRTANLAIQNMGGTRGTERSPDLFRCGEKLFHQRARLGEIH